MNQDSAFVVLQHTTPQGVHWDLMLQMIEVLWTWRMGCPPADIGGNSVEVERIADHPLRFLTYEGPVQNGTGQVNIADKGQLSVLTQSSSEIAFQLNGTSLRGCFVLRLHGQNRWILTAQQPL